MTLPDSPISPLGTTTRREPPSSSCCARSGSSCSRCGSGSSGVLSATTAVVETKKNGIDSADSPRNTRSALDYYAKKLTPHHDERGNVRETYRASWFPMVPPIKQMVRSKSRPRTLRGMHLHRKQWDIWHFVEGKALVRLYNHDLKENFWIEAGPGHVIAIPPGLSHGFYTENGCILTYLLTEEYVPTGQPGSDEFGWVPFDGTNDARWPAIANGLRVSERDYTAPRLVDFRP